MTKGAYIVFEGLNKSGKTTQMKMLIEASEKLGVNFLDTKEPGSPHSELCRDLRKILLNEDQKPNYPISPRAQLLGFYADRAHHNETVVGPALEQGISVYSDRFEDTSKAFQGYAAGLGIDLCEKISEIAVVYRPDLTFFMDLPFEETLARKGLMVDDTYDRYEEMGIDTLKRQYDGYQIVMADRSDVCRVDGMKTPQEIHAEIMGVLSDKFPHIYRLNNF